MAVQADRRPAVAQHRTWPSRSEVVHWLMLAVAVVAGVAVTIRPVFQAQIPYYAAYEFIAHVAAVTATVRTWHETHGLPISSAEILADVEYPYMLFGNTAFYLISAFFSVVLNVPAYVGVGLALAAGFALATGSVYLLAKRAGLNPYLAIALGFLYAAGPYLSVNLFVRNAFPEYLTWQIVPVLIVLVARAFSPQAGPVAMLAGALALAAPFYFHKLVAPHIALTLVALGINAAPWNLRTVPRLVLIGTLSLLFSVPGWYPTLRGLAEGTVRSFGGSETPTIFHTTVVNLFWPYSLDTLPPGAEYAFYEGRFALQAGLVSVVGLVATLGTLLTQPRLAWTRRLPLPIVLYAVYVVLVMGWLRVWDFAPSPLKYVQFSYRLVGMVHLLGFVLLIRALGSSEHFARRLPLLVQRLVAGLFVVVAVIGAATYWYTPPLMPARSDEIRPRQLGQFLRCSFCPPTPWSSFPSLHAIGEDQALVVPPVPIGLPVSAGLTSIVLDGSAPGFVFEQGSESLVVRVYGFAKAAPEARLDELEGILARGASQRSPVASISALYDTARSSLAPNAAPGAAVALGPGGAWTARPLAEMTLARAGRFDLRAPLDQSIAAIAIECSRAVMSNRGLQPQAPPRMRCLDVTALAPPNQGDTLEIPKEIPRRAWTRGPTGQIRIDARELKDGHYMLPTIDYGFVQVVDADGASVPKSHFNRRPVIEHTGTSTAYTVSYDFQPELRAVLAGIVVFLASVLIMRPWRKRSGKIAHPAPIE